VLEAIINMAKDLKLEILAEGVETKQQVEYLKMKGVALAQGFYFSKPIPKEELQKLLSKMD